MNTNEILKAVIDRYPRFYGSDDILEGKDPLLLDDKEWQVQSRARNELLEARKCLRETMRERSHRINSDYVNFKLSFSIRREPDNGRYVRKALAEANLLKEAMNLREEKIKRLLEETIEFKERTMPLLKRRKRILGMRAKRNLVRLSKATDEARELYRTDN